LVKPPQSRCGSEDSAEESSNPSPGAREKYRYQSMLFSVRGRVIQLSPCSGRCGRFRTEEFSIPSPGVSETSP
jgi:hypothetical protein